MLNIGSAYFIASLFAVLMIVGTSAMADPECFARANSDYERVYCQVVAAGEGSHLPAYYEFIRNSPMTQALLLKRPAARAGLKVVLPDREALSTNPKPLMPSPKLSSDQSSLEAQCRVVQQGREITCAAGDYRLIGNLANNQLAPDALSSANLLALKDYRGPLNDTPALRKYLAGSYRHYIDKMLEIGLGGATLTYSKFSFLFFELRRKQVDFVDRFETMFGFLKRDKQRINVDQRPGSNSGLVMDDCFMLTEGIIACETEGRNFLYQL